MTQKPTPLSIIGLALALLALPPGWSHAGNAGYTDSFLASPFAAAFDPAPTAPRLPTAPDQGDAPGGNAASFVSSPFMAAFDPAPLTPRISGTAAMPAVPAGMCRWERTVHDRFGHPTKEYTIGSCLSPPEN